MVSPQLHQATIETSAADGPIVILPRVPVKTSGHARLAEKWMARENSAIVKRNTEDNPADYVADYAAVAGVVNAPDTSQRLEAEARTADTSSARERSRDGAVARRSQMVQVGT